MYLICSVALVVASSIQICVSSCGRNKQTAGDRDGGSGVDFVLFCTFLRGVPKPWKYQRGVWGGFFWLVFLGSSCLSFFSPGRLSDKEPSFVVCASVLLIPLIWNTVITSSHLLLHLSLCSERKNTLFLQPVPVLFVVRTGAECGNGET